MKKEWPFVPLNDVCEFLDRRGVTPEKLGSKFVHSGFRVISAKNVKGQKLDIDVGEQRFVDEPTYRKWMKSPLLKDDVLLTSEAPLGEPAYIAEDLEWCLGQRLFGIRTNKSRLFGRFLYYGFHSNVVRNDLMSRATGATAQGIRQTELKRVAMPVPPLPEQKRIVGILDEAFEGIARAKANAEQNLRNARALFESHLQSVFTQRDHGWPTKQLGDVCDFEGGSQPPKSQFSYAPKAGYVRFLQIRDFASEKHVTFIQESKKNRRCVEDDIMIGRYGASVGKILTGKAGAYNVALMKTVPDRRQLDLSFFYHYLVSRAFQERLMNVAARSAQNGFSKEDIYGFPVPIPALREQQKVIEQLGPLSEETQRLESIYQHKLAALDELKKSLLHQAFSGEL